MSFGDSSAVFEQRSKAIGLSEDIIRRFKDNGLDTMAKLAFACNFSPGGSDDKPFKDLLTKVLGREATLVEESCSDRLQWISWDQCVSREHELMHTSKKDQRLVVQASGELKFTSSVKYEPCDTSSEILLRYCFIRRALAMEQANILAYKHHDKWLEKIMACRLEIVPHGFARTTFQQIEAADKRLFVLLAEKTRGGIKATATGRPCDNHFEACMNSTEVMSLLQPKPIAVRLSDEPPSKKPRLDKPSPDKAPFEKPGKGRNKGKGKATPSQFMRIPTELLSLGCTGATPQGHRLCFSFNLKKCSNNVQNQRCDKGLHLCAVKGCFKQHAAVECPMKKKDWNSGDSEGSGEAHSFEGAEGASGSNSQVLDDAKKFSHFSTGDEARPACVSQETDIDAQVGDWKRDQNPLFLELCSGCGILSATVAASGFDTMAVDHKHNRHRSHVKTFNLDLTVEHSWNVLKFIVQQCNVIAVHIAPPCGTCSRAREIKLTSNWHGPPPLRNAQHPYGVPDMNDKDKFRVQQANQLYMFMNDFCLFLNERSVPWTIENPTNSWLWELPCMRTLVAEMYFTSFHSCAYGGKRYKGTSFLTNHPAFLVLCRQCDGMHEHLPWGFDESSQNHRSSSPQP